MGYHMNNDRRPTGLSAEQLAGRADLVVGVREKEHWLQAFASEASLDPCYATTLLGD